MIRVLYFDGCPNHVAAVALAEDVAKQATPPESVEQVNVTTLEQAEELHFLGSPTIQVGGLDIEPGVDAARAVEFACRVYRTDEGVAGVPPRAWLENALRAGGVELVSTSPSTSVHVDKGGCCET